MATRGRNDDPGQMDNHINPSPLSTTPEESTAVRSTIEEKLADEMGHASFPASDPPATWTWDPR